MLRRKEFARIRWQRTAREHVEPATRPRLDRLLQANLAGEDAGQPDRSLDTQQVGDLGSTQIRLDHQNPAAAIAIGRY